MLKPEKQCYTDEEQMDYGFGDQCRVVSESDNSENSIEYLMNCTQGLVTMSSYQSNKYYDSIIDYSPVNNNSFWMRDTNNLIYLPFDPNITVYLKIRDFKYLSHSYDYSIHINDTDYLIGKKSIKFDLDIKSIPKTAKPGGKMFSQMHVNSTHFHTYEKDRSCFFEIAEYKEPPFSNTFFMFNTTTITLLLMLFVLLWIWLYRWNNRRTKNKLLFDETKNK